MKKALLTESEFKLIKGRVLRTRMMTSMEKLFEIALPDGRSLDHQPGQFVQVCVLGVGEAPISVSSSPTKRKSFELCVRKVGAVTEALHKFEAGDDIGIRGPFGNGFPTRIMEGNDLLIVGGGLGIVPLRSLINYVMDNRRDFGKVTILLGARTPENILFGDEIDQWNHRLDVNFDCTVDVAQPECDWKGHVGLITTLIPGVNLDPNRTFAIVVGPPVMYRHVIRKLLEKAIPERQIIVSLERHMKCGIGKCGHCQIEHYYCCQDGPVFTYDKIKNLEEAI
jgi:sulfhydrogenase subunit gamma (sulfur reductase)